MTFADPIETAREAGLRYVSDAEPGYRRRRAGRSFAYRDTQGRKVSNADHDRIRKLAIPPAWTDVWICPDGRGHLQATGRDARGRKQHIYNAQFREVRDQAKFEHTLEFAAALPAIRAALERDRRKQGLPREKALATLVHLLDTTLIRVGNDEYADENKSYGLTTLRNHHAKVAGDAIQFVFTGKSGKAWRLKMKDRRVARVLRVMQELPGQRLFSYLDENGIAQPLTSTDVNAYLREISGRDVTAKDFRTWAGTVNAAAALAEREAPTSAGAAKRALREVITDVAARLGNTPTICRKCYVHPAVMAAFEDGALELPVSRRSGLSKEEAATLAFLKRVSRPRLAARAPFRAA